MNKQIKIDEVQVILIGIIAFLGTVMLCIEPSDWSEYSLYRYEHYFDKGNQGWYMLIVWYSLIGVGVVYTAIKLLKANKL